MEEMSLSWRKTKYLYLRRQKGFDLHITPPPTWVPPGPDTTQTMIIPCIQCNGVMQFQFQKTILGTGGGTGNFIQLSNQYY